MNRKSDHSPQTALVGIAAAAQLIRTNYPAAARDFDQRSGRCEVFVQALRSRGTEKAIRLLTGCTQKAARQSRNSEHQAQLERLPNSQSRLARIVFLRPSPPKSVFLRLSPIDQKRRFLRRFSVLVYSR